MDAPPEKAERLLSEFVEFHAWPHQSDCTVLTSSDRSRTILVAKTGRWTITGAHRTIDGVHGGRYSIDALYAIEAFAGTKWLSKTDAAVFRGWWRDAGVGDRDKSDLRKVKEIAERLGYKLTKKK